LDSFLGIFCTGLGYPQNPTNADKQDDKPNISALRP
jgi:hypothetical protein